MQAKLSSSVETIGYLATKEQEALGYYGALLVLNKNARPIEFHCTQPVRPKPVQRVLYGGTLDSHLLADQIPQALIQKAKSKLDILLVDSPRMMQFRPETKVPMGLIAPQEAESHTNEEQSNDGLIIGDLQFANHRGIEFAFHRSFQDDQSFIQNAIDEITRNVELDEPFERLSMAMDETCKSSVPAA